MSNSKIGNYTITNNRIGRGAFSTIYKGLDNKLNTVAIKEINCDKRMGDSIKNEFEILKKLDHENIVHLYDIYYHISKYYTYNTCLFFLLSSKCSFL